MRAEGEDHEAGIELIAAERRRQITDEGWYAGHDDQHDRGELAAAAVGYITGDRDQFPLSWTFKPGNRVRDLVKAGALIAAEIDRLQRREA
jgi:hypothetical protein